MQNRMQSFRGAAPSSVGGMALLEMAVMSLAVTLLVFAAVLAIDRFNHFQTAKRIVDHYVHDDALRPLHLVNTGGALQLEVDQGALRRHLEEMVVGASREIQEIIEKKELSGEYHAQMAYEVLSLDPSTGVLSGRFPPNCYEISQLGARAGSACPELVAALDTVASRTSGARSPHAVPTALYGREERRSGRSKTVQYVPYAILIGMRVSWVLNSSGGSLPKRFGLPEEASDMKVTVLRGDISL
ncbi:hypothetical protein MRY87_00120 [bacterium]|nr:hypothetical protein [bacterium]